MTRFDVRRGAARTTETQAAIFHGRTTSKLVGVLIGWFAPQGTGWRASRRGQRPLCTASTFQQPGTPLSS